DHSAYQDKWDRHGGGQVPDRHGPFHRSIAGVLCLPAPAGRGSRCSSTRKLRWELRANKSQRRAVQDPQGPMPCGFTPIDLRFLDLPPWSTNKFATAVRANVFYFLRTTCAKGAFVRANVSLAIHGKVSPALLAFRSHFQCHVVSNRAEFIVSHNYQRNRNAPNEFNYHTNIAR